MSEVTISGTTINLWLFVHGIATIFGVTIGRDNRISELKKVIKKAREPEFDNLALDRLKLLKLKNPVDEDYIFNIRNLILQDYENENDDVCLMKDMRKIVTYWPENQAPPKDLIHVIVEVVDVTGDAGENKGNIHMYRNISSESLLASFIGENVHVRLKSGNYIHMQITSHLGTGKECIVFLAQVRDYGIKDAVLKIEVCKNTEIFQVYREISVLRALSDLSCVPKILFEGHTMGGFRALLTDFVGLPLESWISDNGNIDDYTIFQIILDLLSCLEKIHAHGYTHGDVAIRNVIQRNGHFYLIDFGLATSLQFYLYPWQEIIQDYNGLCQIIGIIKFGEKMSFSELIDKLKGELKSFVAFVEDASRWKIIDEEKCLKKFGAIARQFYEKLPRKVL
ncbi:kinase-like domain-containing protein [Rhizophagus diaphanus]|nr:kinase-like domain-containing protein [Rhizophagus diaphanus] [Rhizophagus sp. MUCL 43196]